MSTSRRTFLAGVAASAAVGVVGAPGAAEAREMVRTRFQEQPGTIVISNSQRSLFLIKEDGRALRYRIAVGKAGKQWEGVTHIAGMHRRPAWTPPAVVRAAAPHLPDLIPGGAPNNPMGEAAMVLGGYGGEYAIHGTNVPGSIGRAASFGCFRMHNEDVLDLFARVSVGTRVVVTR